jgi:putative inorganic carbon (hco3(-)) transporter
MLRSLFVLAILGPGIYGALRSRYLALLVYLWFALFRPQEWIWIDITSLRLSMLLGGILIVPALVAGRYPNVTHPLTLGMVAFICSSILSQFTAVRPELGWQWIDFSVRLFLACMMLVTLTTDAQRLVGVVGVIAGSLGFHAAKAGVAYAIGGGTRFADGLSGAFVDNNGYALGAVMIMPLLLVTGQNIPLLHRGRWTRWVKAGWYAAVPLCALAVIGTYSRGGFLAMASATLAYVLLQRRRAPALIGLSTALVLVIAFVPIPQSYIDRLETIRTYEEIGEDSALSRPHFWRVGLEMALERPLGVGLRQFEVAYDDYDTSYGRFGRQRSVHSAHVQVLAELGVIGAAIWTALFAYATFLCLRIRFRAGDERFSPDQQRFFFTVSNALLTSMVGFVVGGAFLALALNDITWLTFAMIAAADRLSTQALAEADTAPVRTPAAANVPSLIAAPVPLAFRAVGSYRQTEHQR